jgi:4'-phosphopantetheinyl transferase
MSDEVLLAPARHRPTAPVRNALCTRPTGASTAVSWIVSGERDLPGGDGWLSAAEAADYARMRFAKRRCDFRVSRWAAKQAMAALPGCPADPTRLSVGHHHSGAPEAWADGRPLPVGISLSHRAGRALCVLGLGPGQVGCDLELIEPRNAAFVRAFCTERERLLIADGPGEGDLRANLVWSAKESALKVLRTGLRRDTRTVEVSLGERGRVWSALAVRIDGVEQLTGWWARRGWFVLTVVTAVPTPPPIGSDQAGALEAATPDRPWAASPINAPVARGPSRAPMRR